jgi:hypothetical protein
VTTNRPYDDFWHCRSHCGSIDDDGVWPIKQDQINATLPRLNLIERWFREITTKRIRRGSFRSVRMLEQAIYDYIEGHNDEPKPLVWTADLADLLPRIARAHERLDTVQYH